jgi:hypothetical protein
VYLDENILRREQVVLQVRFSIVPKWDYTVRDAGDRGFNVEGILEEPRRVS